MWSAVASCMPTREIWLDKKITFHAGSLQITFKSSLLYTDFQHTAYAFYPLYNSHSNDWGCPYNCGFCITNKYRWWQFSYMCWLKPFLKWGYIGLCLFSSCLHVFLPLSCLRAIYILILSPLSEIWLAKFLLICQLPIYSTWYDQYQNSENYIERKS